MSHNRQDDDLLIRRFQQGDRAAFDDLVSRHSQRAFQYAFRLTKNTDEASDIVSDAFLRVFTALPQFKGNSSFSTWIYRIITNCFLDLRKRDKRKQTVGLEIATANDDGDFERPIESDDPMPEELAVRGEQIERLNDAIHRLPDYQRSMIVMYHGEMLSYEEIAAVLDLPIGTVKSRLNRARIILKDLLANDEELFRVN